MRNTIKILHLSQILYYLSQILHKPFFMSIITDRSRESYSNIFSPYCHMCKKCTIQGGAIIENVNNNQNIRAVKLIDWNEKEKEKTLKDVLKRHPGDAMAYRSFQRWFDQIEENIKLSSPDHDVRRVVVCENMNGEVVNIDYEYYPDDTGEERDIAFRFKTVRS